MKTVLGICGGSGVILHAFQKELIANIEPRAIFHSKGEKQWGMNFSAPMLRNEESFKLIKDPVEVIIGAPDCGHSSVLALSRAKVNTNPWDNESVNLYFKGVERFKPKVWVMENLPGFLEGVQPDDIAKALGNYHIHTHIGPVSEFGNSQVDRVRLTLVGFRKDLVIKKKYPVTPTRDYDLQDCDTLLDGLNYCGDIKVGHIREDLEDSITLYAGYKDTLENIRKEWLFRGTRRWTVVGRNFTTAPGVYLNMGDDYPKTARKANRQFNKYGLMMTPRELARIQGVPDDFGIYIDKDEKGYWINKGRASVTKCPPYEWGVWFYQYLKQHQII
jgi:site-specific DNA-cytosine methylase